MNSNFYFLGNVPDSKSLLNRALLVKSYFKDFQVEGHNSCDDIKIMEKAIENLKVKKELNCGLSGTAFRFLSLRVSREKGTFLLTGEPALFKRPLQEVTQLLAQLSVESSFVDKGLKITSDGWNPQGDYVNVPSNITSQWVSSLLLNGWNLNRDLYFSFNTKSVSYSYFKMTLDLVKSLGLDVEGSNNEYRIKKNQSLKVFKYKAEQDQSSLFVLAALAALKGKAVFTNWNSESLQPDIIFLDFLKNMGVDTKMKNTSLEVNQCFNLQPLSVNLKSCPDLFPVLSVLCSKAQGVSKLSGLSHTAFKESNRIKKVIELLKFVGVDFKNEGDALIIKGQNKFSKIKPFSFDSDQDHRIVMAATLFKEMGIPIDIKNKKTVSKSFPEFFKIVESL